MVSFLDEREQPTDCVLVSSASFATPRKHYSRELILPVGGIENRRPAGRDAASVLFVVFRINNITPDRPVAFTEELRRRAWRDLDRADFYGLQVVTFSRRRSLELSRSPPRPVGRDESNTAAVALAVTCPSLSSHLANADVAGVILIHAKPHRPCSTCQCSPRSAALT